MRVRDHVDVTCLEGIEEGRAVTNRGVTADDIDRVIASVAEALHTTAPHPAGEPAPSAA